MLPVLCSCVAINTVATLFYLCVCLPHLLRALLTPEDGCLPLCLWSPAWGLPTEGLRLRTPSPLHAHSGGTFRPLTGPLSPLPFQQLLSMATPVLMRLLLPYMLMTFYWPAHREEQKVSEQCSVNTTGHGV